MQELYSNADDCFELAKLLKRKLGNKIEFYGSPYQGLISGKYFSHYREPHSDIDYLFEKGLPFYYKFCKEGFLRVQVGSCYRHNNSVGERLAALSDFYGVLNEEYGSPTVFYTTKDDDEGLLSLHWSFVNKEEDVEKFKNGTFFEDAEIDTLVVIGEPRVQTEGYQLSDTTRELISRKVGLPIELINLVDENIEDFVKYKTGKELSIPRGAKIDCVPVTSFESKSRVEKTLRKQK